MNIVNSLKKLYTSLGGNADTVKDVQTAPDMVDALSEIAASTIELPAVDAEDNGKVLKVADGKWAKGTDAALPEVSAEDEGDVLTVNAEGEWTNAEPVKELPTVTASDNGSVLSVVDGVWAKGLKIKKISFENKSPSVNGTECWLWLSGTDYAIFGREGNASIISVFISTTNTYGASYSVEGIEVESTSVGIKVRKNERGAYSTTTDPLSGEIYYIERF